MKYPQTHLSPFLPITTGPIAFSRPPSLTTLSATETAKSRCLNSLRTLKLSCSNFPHRHPLFSIACALFNKNTGGGGVSRTIAQDTPRCRSVSIFTDHGSRVTSHGSRTTFTNCPRQFPETPPGVGPLRFSRITGHGSRTTSHEPRFQIVPDNPRDTPRCRSASISRLTSHESRTTCFQQHLRCPLFFSRSYNFSGWSRQPSRHSSLATPHFAVLSTFNFRLSTAEALFPLATPVCAGFYLFCDNRCMFATAHLERIFNALSNLTALGQLAL